MNKDRKILENLEYENISDEEIEKLENEKISSEIIKGIKDRFTARIFEEDRNIINLQNKSFSDMINAEKTIKKEFLEIEKDYVELLTKDETIKMNFVSFNPFGVGGLHSYDACQYYRVIYTDKSLVLMGFNYVNKPINVSKFGFSELNHVIMDHYSKKSYTLTIYGKEGSYFILTCETEEFKKLVKEFKTQGIKTRINENYKLRVFLYWLFVFQCYLYVPFKMYDLNELGAINFVLIIVNVLFLFKINKSLRKII